VKCEKFQTCIKHSTGLVLCHFTITFGVLKTFFGFCEIKIENHSFTKFHASKVSLCTVLSLTTEWVLINQGLFSLISEEP